MQVEKNHQVLSSDPGIVLAERPAMTGGQWSAGGGRSARSVIHSTFGSPTSFVNDEIYFGKDRLRDVEEEIVRIE
ncbi:MAG: hypothetical protein QF921_18450 [Pseudomonadales bacterium]|jgi:2-hydroxychromene-2-carboxylate isomerase|nr:hypothetical protein [Pseudomonadales bacterium]MDP6472350.1 hypothetical protein [Pseudomonadales bacterium]MDP6828146.1 hypothetical protein [Pseudomonadales bacterium]MDP6973469.1 hypothetical protein [Pseudomonadales bacterium]|tara:strand:- start:2230 stop:2454 length:225 start_codon:yes stop_codon:yes gene_type:complete